MPQKVYDVLKWVIITVVPAAIALISALGNIYGFDSSVIVATIAAVAAFAGTVLGIDSVYYGKQQALEKANATAPPSKDAQ